MFHLCSMTEPGKQFTSDNLSQIFDPRNSGYIVRRTYKSFANYVNWFKASITDETFPTWAALKVFGQAYGDIDYLKQRHEYQLYLQAFANKPKYLLEYIMFAIDWDGGCRIYFNKPSLTDAGFRYQNDKVDLTYQVTRGNSNSDDYYITGTAAFTENTLTIIHSIIDSIEVSVNESLTHEKRDEQRDREALQANTFSTFCRFVISYLGDHNILQLKNPIFGFSGSQRPSIIAERIAGLSDEAAAKAQVIFTLERDKIDLWYREPRMPASREHVSQIFNYTTNVLDILPLNIRGTKDVASPLYGIELEACSDYSPEQIIAAQQELFFIMKHDATITGDKRYKYEMVTVPSSYRAHKRLWAEFFNKVDYTKFDTSRSTGNGMHVHVSRDSFKPKHLERFTWFMINPANHDFLFELSERPNKNDLLRWAPFPSIMDSKPKAMRNAVNINRGMRGAIHFKGSATVEIRIFKGVVSYATIVKNLEFVDSLFHFTQQSTTTTTTLIGYLAWLNTLPKNRYALLRQFLADSKNMEQVLISNEVRELLYTENNPQHIITKLNSGRLTVTNKHLTVLNRERRKRTFILGKDGKVSLAYATGGKLAALDKEMQSRITRGSSSITISVI